MRVAHFLVALLASSAHAAPWLRDTDLASVLMVGLQGTAVDADIERDVGLYGVGGVVLFSKNLETPEQTQKLIADLKRMSQRRHLWVAVDAEGGGVKRFESFDGHVQLPSALALAHMAPQAFDEAVGNWVDFLVRLGFNLNFAPCVDLAYGEDNVITRYGRSFGRDPQEVIVWAKRFVERHHERGVATTLKHFPGHGSTQIDSHFDLPDVTHTHQEEELIPYQQLGGTTPWVMTSHLWHDAWGAPCSLSKACVHDQLRDTLKYRGRIITDDLQMEAVLTEHTLDEVVVQALQAGNTMVLVGNNINYLPDLVPRLIATLRQAVQDERLPVSLFR